MTGPEPAGSLIPAVAAYARRHAIFSAGDLVVLAVSGGADSICMLHCLHALQGVLGLRLHVAHVHHGLRGVEADGDAEYVATQAAQYGLPCSVLQVDVPALQRQARRSPEAAARQARYAALRGLAATIGATSIATAHTEDDQAETLLLHLLRGSGIDGLCGMHPHRGDLVRPLLAQSRRAIEEHCRAYGLTPREDATNRDLAFRRNAIRHELLPLLETYNPQIRAALARTAHLLAQDATYLHTQAAATLEILRQPDMPDTIALSRSRFAILPPGLRLHILRLAIEMTLGNTDGLTAEHLEAIDALARSGHAGRRWQLPHRLRAEAAGDVLRLHIASAATPTPVPVELSVPGSAQFGSWRLGASAMRLGDRGTVLDRLQTQAGATAVWCDQEAIAGALVVRGRLPGDRLRPMGLAGTRKLQDLFVDRKVPREERDSVPLVVDSSGIVWVVGHALDVRVAVTSETKTVVQISAQGTA